MARVVGLGSPREVAGWWGVTMEVEVARRRGGWGRAGVSEVEVPDLGRCKCNGFGDPRWRWKGGVSSEMRRLMRVRHVRSCEEGAEREHERLAEREEPHCIKDSPIKGHRIEVKNSRCP